MRKILNILGKIILIICIILLIVYIVSFIIGIYDGYHNGVKKEGFFIKSDEIVYGNEAIDVYLSNSCFEFCLYSMFGILPCICIPVFVAILLRFKKLFSKKIRKNVIIIVLVMCIFLHIIAFKEIYDELLVLLPYIESLIVSYLITRVILKNRNIC